MKFIEEVFISQLTDAMIKRQKRLLLAEEMFDISTKRMNTKEKQTDGTQSGAKANESGQNSPDSDAEEENLDDFNAKAKANEKVKEDESSSEDDEDVEGDNTTQRIKNRRNQDLDYEEPEDDDLLEEKEEEEKEELKEEEEDDDKDQQGGDGGDIKEQEEEEKETEKEEAVIEEPLKKRKKADLLSSDKISARVNQVRSKPYVLDYEIDTEREKWCTVTICINLTTTRLDMGSLVESEARKTYVHRVGNIQRALIVKDMNAKSRGAICDKMIKTEGVSLLSLVKYNNILDLNAVYSNDIHAIANTYGIEAASQAIRREMANVFAVYGIEVDSHHLSLIADYMTYNGAIRGMNRNSMEASASPFQQMSFESTVRYLKWAAILGLYDDIKSPSAALVFGKPTRGGTGLFTTLADNSVNNKADDNTTNINEDDASSLEW